MITFKEVVKQFFTRNHAYLEQYRQFNPTFKTRLNNFIKTGNYHHNLKQRLKDLFFHKEVNPKTGMDIYETGTDVKTFVTHQYRIHSTFKHKFFYPLLFIARKILGKYMTTKIDNKGKYNQWRNLRILNEAHEKTLFEIKLTKEMSSKDLKIEDIDVDKLRKSLDNDEPYQMLRDMMGLVLTIAKNDTYYLNYIEMMMYNITTCMNKEYREELHKRKIGHLIYTSKMVQDVAYFSIKQHRGKIILKNLELFRRKAKKDWEKGIALCEQCSNTFEAKICNKCKGIKKIIELQKQYATKNGI